MILIILGKMGVDIRKSINSPVTQSNFEYIKEVTVFAWNKYLKEPVKFLWDVFVKYVWTPAINILKGNVLNKFKSARSTEQTVLFS